MKKALVLFFLLSFAAQAQFTHRSNPGQIGGALASVTAAGFNSGVCLATGGTNSVFITLSGTWSGTVNFAGTNDKVNSKAIVLSPYGAASGEVGAPVLTATANGDFSGSTLGFAYICTYMSVFVSGTLTASLDADPSIVYSVAQFPSANGFRNEAVTTVVQVKATGGAIYQISASNNTAAAAFLQVFCLPSASVTLGTTAPNYTVQLKSNAAAGDERDIAFPTGLCSQGTGISVAGTTTATGSTTASVGVALALL